MEKRFQVFVSSTFRDLEAERATVMQSLLELDCIPSGMELFPAASEDQWTVIKRVIEDCDYYLLLLAGRYGSTDSDGIGYTEKEYDYAISIGKPTIAFVHADPGKIAVERAEQNSEGQQKLKTFRDKVRKKLCKDWRNREELAGLVTTSLVKLIKNNPAEGWVRARYAADPEDLRRLNAYQQKVEQLEIRLAKVQTSPPAAAGDFASGSEKKNFDIRFSIRSTVTPQTLKVAVSWDELFSILGPKLFSARSETSLASYFAKELQRFIPQHIRDDVDGGPWIDDQHFQRVKIQMIALGLIEFAGETDTRKGDSDSLWKLTAYGISFVTKLLAIRSSSKDD